MWQKYLDVIPVDSPRSVTIGFRYGKKFPIRGFWIIFSFEIELKTQFNTMRQSTQAIGTMREGYSTFRARQNGNPVKILRVSYLHNRNGCKHKTVMQKYLHHLSLFFMLNMYWEECKLYSIGRNRIIFFFVLKIIWFRFSIRILIKVVWINLTTTLFFKPS